MLAGLSEPDSWPIKKTDWLNNENTCVWHVQGGPMRFGIKLKVVPVVSLLTKRTHLLHFYDHLLHEKVIEKYLIMQLYLTRTFNSVGQSF